MSLFVVLKRWIEDFTASETELYLNAAVDAHDFEYRMQRITYGEAPFQRRYTGFS